MATATIERRYENAGFVYTARTRMIFAPYKTMFRHDAPPSENAIGIGAASRWPEPNKADLAAIIAALCKAGYTNIYADTAGEPMRVSS